MNFSEALEAMKQGKRASRRDWDKSFEGCFVSMENIENKPNLEFFVPSVSLYTFDLSIALSEDWIVKTAHEVIKNVNFPALIEYLSAGAIAYLPGWDHRRDWIKLDHDKKNILLNTYFLRHIPIQYDSFIATDWFIIDEEAHHANQN